MRNESRLFNIVAAFLYLCAGTYAWGTDKATRIEWAGTIALLLSATLAVSVGMYFAFVARRIPPRPEDRDTPVEDGAGTIGFFSPGSYWPLGLGLSTTVGAVGIAMDQWWLAGLALVAVFLSTGGLLFEYYTVKGGRPAD
jgi:hypothetical protein